MSNATGSDFGRTSTASASPGIAFGAGRARPRLLVSVAAVLLTASSCMLAPIPGPAPLRYRDAVFTQVTKTSDIVYGSARDQAGNTVTLKLDLYRPAGDRVTRRPLIIWVHGGFFSGGDKSSPEIVDEATTFAKKGYVTASINYRVSPNGCRPPVGAECIQAIYDANTDAQSAVRFLRSTSSGYGVDHARIAIGGSSAGAITALLTGYRFASPGATPPSATSEVRAAVSLSGAVILTDAVGSGDAPALLFHGTNDRLVPYTWAVDTVRKARSAGLIAELVTWEGGGHVPYTQHRDEILDLTTNFLYRTLDSKYAGH